MVGEPSETQMDLETALADSEVLLKQLPKIKKTVESKVEGEYPAADSTFWLQLTSEYLDQLKIQNPKVYEAAIEQKKAINSISGREGEKRSGYLALKVQQEMFEQTGQIDYMQDPELLVGSAIGKVSKGIEISTQTKVDLFRYGLNKIIADTNDKGTKFDFSNSAAGDRQIKFDQSNQQTSPEPSKVNSPSEIK